MHDVLLVAEPFGFGPAGSLMTLRESVRWRAKTWRYLGPEYTRSIVDGAGLDGCCFYDSARGLAPDEMRRHVSRADVVVCGTDFSAAVAAVDHGKRVVILDPLFWYWREIPRLPRDRLLWLCVNFPGVRERIESLPSPERQGLLVVSLGDAGRPSVKKDLSLLTINLSGWYNPVCTFDGYSAFVLEALLPVLERICTEQSSIRRVTLCGNSACLPEIQTALTRRGLRLETLSHHAMQVQIAQSGLLLTTPGLNATLEAFRHGTCVAWLPPQNDSQLLQLLAYQKADLAECPTDWYALAGRPYRGRGHDQASDIIDMVQCAEGGRRTRALGALADALGCVFDMDAAGRLALAQRQTDFYRSLCDGDAMPLDQVSESTAWRDVLGS
jgi:hypothetical protein